MMKVKKYPQSHLVITSDSGKKLIIDPGYITFEKFKVSDFQGADLYLITHQHGDHLDPATIKEVVGDKPIFGNADVVRKLAEVGIKGNEVVGGQAFEAAGFNIIPVDIPHFGVLGKNPPQNTGFLIDGVFFHPGDGVEAPDLQADNLALRIADPYISPGNYGKALEFAQKMQAKLVIPIHYDARYPADTEEFKKVGEENGLEVRILDWGEETII